MLGGGRNVEETSRKRHKIRNCIPWCMEKNHFRNQWEILGIISESVMNHFNGIILRNKFLHGGRLLSSSPLLSTKIGLSFFPIRSHMTTKLFYLLNIHHIILKIINCLNAFHCDHFAPYFDTFCGIWQTYEHLKLTLTSVKNHIRNLLTMTKPHIFALFEPICKAFYCTR